LFEEMKGHKSKLNLVGVLILLIVPLVSLSACDEGSTNNPSGSLTYSNTNLPINSPSGKVSSQLMLQVSLRMAQIENPSSQKLAQMQMMGMQEQNIGVQRIYIYLCQPLTPAQVSDLQSMGITLYLDSWISPAGNNPRGFMLADMPADKLNDLAAKDYVVSLDTAERPSQPQSDVQTGG
jgi:hypothetical protein